MLCKHTSKAGIVLCLTLVLLIPLQWIADIIEDRNGYRAEAEASIANSWTGPQQVVGPILVLPYQQSTPVEAKTVGQRWETMTRHRVWILPDVVTFEVAMHTELRYRGIFKVPVYRATMQVAGQFIQKAIQAIQATVGEGAVWGDPYLVLLVGDTRGFSTRPVLQWGEQPIPFAASTAPPGEKPLLIQATGIHAPLTPVAAADYPFRFELSLRGMEQLAFAPIGEDTVVNMRSDWPDPQFSGRFLPERREISPEGFTAQWRTSSFAGSIQQILSRCQEIQCPQLLDDRFGITLIQPVDNYQQAMRSVKYGVLLIALAFAAALLFEVLSRRRLHPVQYGLVGLALAMFYLLLVALSEHLPFNLAYGLAALAVTVLVTGYALAATRQRLAGLGFGAGIASLYAVLYIILSSEGSALLMGSLLLFAVLAAIMWLTRSIDWYAVELVGAPPANSAASGGNQP